MALVQRDGRVPTDLLENALEAVVRGLGSARAKLEAAGGQLAAMRVAEWSQATLAAADMCLHSEEWHAAWHADVGAGGKEAYLRTVGLVRDMLRDDLLPLLCAAAAQQTAETGFLLTAQYQAVLAMGKGGEPWWAVRYLLEDSAWAAGARVLQWFRGCWANLLSRGIAAVTT